MKTHAIAAEQSLHQAILLCPSNAFNELALGHCDLGFLYWMIGLFESARDHFEKSINYHEKTDNRIGSGISRLILAQMYLSTLKTQQAHVLVHDFLHRARAFARAALNDFQHYKGINDYVDTCQRLLADIDRRFKDNKAGPK